MAEAARKPQPQAPYGEQGRTATDILTPEGVTLPFVNASIGERMGAVVIDVIIISLLSIIPGIIFFVIIVSSGQDFEEFVKSHKAMVATLSVLNYFFQFFLQSGYFIVFEMGRHAATPGKRLMKLRVIARDGGHVTPAAIFTRNALRIVETNIPVMIMLSAASFPPGIGLLAFFWALALLLLPLFNRQHARLGDFLAGTLVVHMPKARLSHDLADLDGDRNLGLSFTPDQLAYGEMELGVLEQVLRERKPAVMKAVADKIKTRINWQAPKNPADMPSDEAFLRAYYGALRAWLEGKMLLGKRRKDKFDPALQ